MDSISGFLWNPKLSNITSPPWNPMQPRKKTHKLKGSNQSKPAKFSSKRATSHHQHLHPTLLFHNIFSPSKHFLLSLSLYKMLSRAFTKPWKSPKNGENSNSKSQSIDGYYDECNAGWFMEDLPLVFCGDDSTEPRGSQIKLREVLRSSVGVIGKSRLGMTEKVVWSEVRKVYAVKRFRKVAVNKREFGRSIQRVAQVSRRCKDYLVPVTAFLYSKRIKFVVCDYFPMGSLADLLSGGREHGHTVLNWNQRLTIILHIARAISFIHSQSPPREKNMQMNVHGNIKPSNIMITVDFTARLSDYGFTQLGEPVEEISDTEQPMPPISSENIYYDKLCQKSDVYNFGVIILDMLGGPNAPNYKNCVRENIEEINNGTLEFFEFAIIGNDRKQALQVLDIALACTNIAENRPSMEIIMLNLEDVVKRNR